MANHIEPVSDCDVEPECGVFLTGGVDLTPCIGTDGDASCFEYQVKVFGPKGSSTVCNSKGSIVPVGGVFCCEPLEPGGCFTTCELPFSDSFDPTVVYQICIVDRRDRKNPRIFWESPKFVIESDVGVECGDTINIKDLITGTPGENNTFCKQVIKCLPDLNIISPDGSINTNVTGNWTDGWVFEVEDAASSMFTFDQTGPVISLTHTPGDGEPVTMGEFDICAIVDEFCPHFVSAFGVDIQGDTITWTFDPGDGTAPVTESASICELVAANCDDQFAFVPNPDGSITITHTSVGGVEVSGTIPAPIPSTLTGGVTGSVFQIVHDNGAGTVETVSVDLCEVIAANCNATYIINEDGSATFTDNAGDTVTIPAHLPSAFSGIEGFAGPGTYTLFHSTDGTPENTTAFTIDVCNIVAASCNASYIINGDGSATFTDNAGDTVTIPAHVPSSVTPVVTGGNVIATHTDGAGNTVNIEESVTALVNDPAAGTFTYTNEAGETVTVDYCDCPDGALTIADGVITYTGSDGNVYPVTLPVSSASFVANPDGSITLTHTNGNGDEETITIPAPVEDVDVDTTVIVENGPVTTITNPDTGGTSTVLNNVLVNNGTFGGSRDIDPAADILLHEGDIADPASWPHDCPIETSGQPVYKGPNGLVTDPCTGVVCETETANLTQWQLWATALQGVTFDALGGAIGGENIWFDSDDAFGNGDLFTGFTNNDPCGRDVCLQVTVHMDTLSIAAQPDTRGIVGVRIGGPGGPGLCRVQHNLFDANETVNYAAAGGFTTPSGIVQGPDFWDIDNVGDVSRTFCVNVAAGATYRPRVTMFISYHDSSVSGDQFTTLGGSSMLPTFCVDYKAITVCE